MILKEVGYACIDCELYVTDIFLMSPELDFINSSCTSCVKTKKEVTETLQFDSFMRSEITHNGANHGYHRFMSESKNLLFLVTQEVVISVQSLQQVHDSSELLSNPGRKMELARVFISSQLRRRLIMYT